MLLDTVMQPIISITAPTPTDVKPTIHGRIFRTTTFFADAALFDMVRRRFHPASHRIESIHKLFNVIQDGTLTDSIAAVEAAWSKVACELGLDPAFVIAATHGKRAIDNLARFKPHLRSHEVSAGVDEFERSILFYADAYGRAARSSTPSLLSDAGSSSGPSSGTSSRLSSLIPSAVASTEQLVSGPRTERQLTLADELAAALSAASESQGADGSSSAWELEAATVDRAVRILPGVKALLESIPKGRYAVATSGAKTYGALLLLLPFAAWADFYYQPMDAFLEWALCRRK